MPTSEGGGYAEAHWLTGTEVAGVVKQFHREKASGEDQIFTAFYKMQDVDGLEVWDVATLGDQGVSSNYRRITHINLPEKVYVWLLGREVQLNFRFRRKNVVSILVVRQQDKHDGMWVFAQLLFICFVDMKKAYDCVPHGVL